MERKSLSLHEKVLLAVVAIAGLIVLFYMFLYQPQRDEIAALEVKVEEKKKEVAQFENFDKTIADTNLEIEDYDGKIYEQTLNWFPSIEQDDIIKDIEPKLKKTGLDDTTVTFVNTQIAQISSLVGEKDKAPTLAEALALAYVTMIQAEATPDPNASPAPTASPAAKGKATPAPTATPATSASSIDTDSNKLATEQEKTSDSDEQLIAPEVQEKFDALAASMQNLSDAELQAKVKEIAKNNVANIQKLTVAITFSSSTYQNIMDFVHSIEASSPAIYISDISYSDSTEAYISELERKKKEELEKESETLVQGVQEVEPDELFDNAYPAASLTLSQVMQNKSTLVNYTGPTRYTGSITLTYFAIAKIHDQTNPVAN